MKQPHELLKENEALRARLSRLSRASMRINESLDFDTVLHGVLDSACSLTGARYGVITLLGNAVEVEDFLTFGMSPAETELLKNVPNGMRFVEYFSGISAPIRLRDLLEHFRAQGPARLPPAYESERSSHPIGGAHPPQGRAGRQHLCG